MSFIGMQVIKYSDIQYFSIFGKCLTNQFEHFKGRKRKLDLKAIKTGY